MTVALQMEPMHRPSYSSETGGEDWQQTFASMAVFSLLLFASTALFRYPGCLGQFAPAPILDGLRNWAIILVTVALSLYAWRAWIRHSSWRRRVDMRGTALLFGITLSALCAIVTVRTALSNIGLGARSLVIPHCIQALDFAGSLIVPMASTFLLIMLPHISLGTLRTAAKLLTVCCLLAIAALLFTTHATTVHAAPKAPASPLQRQPYHRA
jgi:hypothetical protein